MNDMRACNQTCKREGALSEPTGQRAAQVQQVHPSNLLTIDALNLEIPKRHMLKVNRYLLCAAVASPTIRAERALHHLTDNVRYGYVQLL